MRHRQVPRLRSGRSVSKQRVTVSKIIKKILSPAQIRAGDRRRQQRQEYEDRLKDERRRNEVLLAPDGNVDVRNAEAQKGRRLSRHDFVRKLQRMNPNLWYEQSNNYPDQGGVYINDPLSPYGKRLVAGFPHDFINEFAVRFVKPALQPSGATNAHWQSFQEVDNQVPGWRQVLLKLIIDGLIAPSDAEREFKISQGRSSKKWQEANAL